MKKILPVILLLAAVTLSACGSSEVNEGKTVNQENKENTTSSQKSLKELLGLGTSQKCTYEVNEDGSQMKGEIVINGDKFKQSVEINNDQGSMMVYTLSDGTYYYTWGDAMKNQGTKMKIADLQSDAQEVSKENSGSEAQKVDWDKKINYNCVAATVDETNLTLPTDVEFVDFTETMKSLQQGNLEDMEKLIPSEEEEE